MRLKKIAGKNKITLIIITLFIITAISFTAYIYGHDKLVGENPIDGLNEHRSHIIVKGENYSLNYEQEKEYEEEQTKKEDYIKEQAVKRESEKKGFTPKPGKGKPTGNGQNQGGGRDQGEGEGGGNTGGEEEKSRLPVITTSLREGYEVSGSMLAFTVSAVDYKGYRIRRGNFDVKVNGIKIYSAGTDYQGTYRSNVNSGSNTVMITVHDDKGHTAVKTYTVTADQEAPPKAGGTVTVTVEARTVGLGYLISSSNVEFYEGENVAYVIKRALEKNGFTARTQSNPNYGMYIAGIGKPGITNGAVIPKKIQDKLDKEGASAMGISADSLGEGDFYGRSGWVFLYNNWYIDRGTSSIDLSDGDEIYMAFTTHFGYEYDGTWFYGKW